MLRVDVQDKEVLARVVFNHSIDDVSSLVERQGFVFATFPCRADEHIVMDALDVAGVGYSILKG